jgi:hypothetical protein
MPVLGKGKARTGRLWTYVREAALRGPRLPPGRRLGLVIGFVAGCGLLDLLKAQQQLIPGSVSARRPKR